MQLLIATHNQHKLQEIRAILGETFECRSLEEFAAAPLVIEDQSTFEGNARKKAVAIAAWAFRYVSLPAVASPAFVLADDSGLEVDALGGQPGVRSARYAGNHGNAAANNQKLLEALRKIPPEKRTARFRCVVALVAPSEHPDVRVVTGTCEGCIIDHARGSHGFGYDPLFVPEGYTQTFAELGTDTKNEISHRAKALAQLAVMLRADFCHGLT